MLFYWYKYVTDRRETGQLDVYLRHHMVATHTRIGTSKTFPLAQTGYMLHLDSNPLVRNRGFWTI